VLGASNFVLRAWLIRECSVALNLLRPVCLGWHRL